MCVCARVVTILLPLPFLPQSSHLPPPFPPSLPSLVGYIGEFEIVDDHRGGKIVIDLIGRINKVGVLSPRFDVKYGEYENWVNNVLPSRQVRSLLVYLIAGNLCICCCCCFSRKPCLLFLLFISLVSLSLCVYMLRVN